MPTCSLTLFWVLYLQLINVTNEKDMSVISAEYIQLASLMILLLINLVSSFSQLSLQTSWREKVKCTYHVRSSELCHDNVIKKTLRTILQCNTNAMPSALGLRNWDKPVLGSEIEGEWMKLYKIWCHIIDVQRATATQPFSCTWLPWSWIIQDTLYNTTMYRTINDYSAEPLKNAFTIFCDCFGPCFKVHKQQNLLTVTLYFLQGYRKDYKTCLCMLREAFETSSRISI